MLLSTHNILYFVCFRGSIRPVFYGIVPFLNQVSWYPGVLTSFFLICLVQCQKSNYFEHQ